MIDERTELGARWRWTSPVASLEPDRASRHSLPVRIRLTKARGRR